MHTSMFPFQTAGRWRGSSLCAEWGHHEFRWQPDPDDEWRGCHPCSCPLCWTPWRSRHIVRLMYEITMFLCVVWLCWLLRASSHPHHRVLLRMRVSHSLLPSSVGSQLGSCWYVLSFHFPAYWKAAVAQLVVWWYFNFFSAGVSNCNSLLPEAICRWSIMSVDSEASSKCYLIRLGGFVRIRPNSV